ncbi:MAG: hypothetical protein ABSA67_06670 [Candidatus Brocadiia bacterium]|jgi:hypothetical protein
MFKLASKRWLTAMLLAAVSVFGVAAMSGGGNASAAEGNDADTLSFGLADGSYFVGHASFTLSQETPYGTLKVPSKAVSGVFTVRKKGSISSQLLSSISSASYPQISHIQQGPATQVSTLDGFEFRARGLATLTEMTVVTDEGAVTIKPEQVARIERKPLPAPEQPQVQK